MKSCWHPSLASKWFVCLPVLFIVLVSDAVAVAQSLQDQLLSEGASKLAKAARIEGDAQRGALIFHQALLACASCHTGEFTGLLGPDLSRPEPGTTPERLVEAVLEPSKLIRKGFEPQTIQTTKGESLTGFLVSESDSVLVLRDLARNGTEVTIPKTTIDERVVRTVSVMPPDQSNQLANRQQFLDLIRYLIEISDGGPERAKQLQPPASLLVLQVPDYEKEIDHAGLIRGLNSDSFKRGEAIYNRLCINCHGTADQPGSLPTSLKFASGTFKNGSDPYRMYLTLTHGYGLMAPQTWMVPTQKYDVVYYVREAYLKPRNIAQYTQIDEQYLQRLPKGTQKGPAPSNIEPWSSMNYGAFLSATYEVPEPRLPEDKVSEVPNLVQKGIAVRLDSGPGGVARGRNWMVFEHDTLRMAAAWRLADNSTEPGFIDWNAINFNGRHQVHPKLSGEVQVSNRAPAGWANPESGNWQTQRTVGRDGRQYGPLPKTWGRYKGLYQYGEQVIFSYSVGESQILEQPGMSGSGAETVYTRTFEIGPRTADLTLSVATHPNPQARLAPVRSESGNLLTDAPVAVVVSASAIDKADSTNSSVFAGSQSIQVNQSRDFDLTNADYSIVVRFRTREGGTLFSQSAARGPWVHDSKALFVRGGKLCFDIGWVGVVTSNKTVADGNWHDAVMTWTKATGLVQLSIDGRVDVRGVLRPKQDAPEFVIRLGYGAADFPDPSYFKGEITETRFYQRCLNEEEAAIPVLQQTSTDQLLAHWRPMSSVAESSSATNSKPRNDRGTAERKVPDLSKRGHWGVMQGPEIQNLERERSGLVAGVSGNCPGKQWRYDRDGGLQLRIPRGPEPLRFVLSFAQHPCRRLTGDDAIGLNELPYDQLTRQPVPELGSRLRGGPRRWPELLTSTVIPGQETGPFAVDILSAPVSNPWFCQMRFTGLDFFSDGDRMAVSAWDGDIWLVSGLKRLSQLSDMAETQTTQAQAAADKSRVGQLTWQRIASGLFQPLGIKIVDDQIYVTCRDQIVILRDLNGDHETDFYECFNSDHQVTEHFHEFAMGLQRDAAGNFYYAKSARHALPAVVPHHGTLLRVSADGSRTDIVATGFRAANGVCLNPDGTFVVTDQEGHWNPKNRINWVREGGFYGNMFGYHDVTDTSDAAMQPPLCWITNAFDRSPAELLWVDSDRWGPLKHALLNFSYGYGKAFIVPHEILNGQAQGGMCELPLPTFPTGIMRGRFSPSDGQLYVCGMFAWAGSAVQPGGLFRIRYTGKPVYLPAKLEALKTGMKLTMTGDLDAKSVADPTNFSIQTWTLKRTADYGSKHYNERSLKVKSARLELDGHTIWLEIPDIEPTWCMEIRYTLRTKTGELVNGTIHNTVHRLRQNE